MGHPAIGVMLDCFHWHCAGETPDDVRGLSDKQVVGVHVNDAIAGRSTDEQMAMERELPRASGEIDLRAFLQALQLIEYDGPVTAEPMSRALEALPRDAAIAATRGSMLAMFADAGIDAGVRTPVTTGP
ncbi:MAG: TIM barrel protein [Tepidisphaeraceae bacterium]